MGNAGARLGLQLGGSIIGSYFGPVGSAIGGMLGSVAGSLLFPDDPINQQAEGPRLGDLSVQTSTYGNAIPILYGTVRVAGNVIWSTGLIEHVNTLTQDVNSGKGGSTPTSTLTTYTYTVSMAISLCNNSIVGIKKIWADDKLWYDFAVPPVGVAFQHELFLGTETQLPCSAIEADKGAGNVPAFRGQAYIVFKDLDLTAFGNRVPNLHFEVVCEGTNALSAQFYTDSAPFVNSFLNRVEIDPETGLVWYTRSAQNRIIVITPDLVVVHESLNEISAPYMLSYQPPYQYIKKSSLPGSVPQLKEMEPRMFVSSHVWDILSIGGVGAGSVDTRDYQMRLAAPISFPFPYFIWLGIVEVDRRTIDVNDIGQEGRQYAVFGGANVNMFLYPGAIYEKGISLYDPIQPVQKMSNLASNDLVTGGAFLYHIGSEGDVQALDEDYQIKFSRSVTDDFAGSFNRLAYDKFEDKLYVLAGEWPSGKTFLVKLSADLAVEHWRVERINLSAWQTLDIHPQTGALYALSQDFGGPWHLHEMDKATGAYLTDYVVQNTAGKIWLDMKIYPNSNFAMVAYVAPFQGAGIARMPLSPAPTGNPPTLQAVVENIASQTGLAPSEVNASALASDFVSGYALSQRMTARTALEPLMRGYFFDAMESDYIAKFVKRGGASVKTISYLDADAREDGAASGAQRERERIEENEMPWQVDVTYLDVASFYKTNVQYARRLIGQSKTAVNVQLPYVLTADQAKRISEVLLYNTWVERQSAKVKLPRKYLDLDPTDVVTFASAPNLPLLDNFDRPNEAPPSKWTTAEGTGLKIVGGVLLAVDVAANRGAIYADAFYADIEVEVTVGWMDLDSPSGWAIALRKQSVSSWFGTTNDYYEAKFLNVTNSGIKGAAQIRRYVGGAFTNITSLINTLAAFKYGDRLRFAAKGSTFAFYVNDVRVLLGADTAIPTGNYIGLLSYQDKSEIREVRVGPSVLPTTQDYRVIRAEYTAPNMVELSLVEEDTSAYSSVGAGVPSNPPSQTVPSLVPTLVYFMDMPIMGRELDNDAGFYIAVAPSFGATWPGAGVYRSDDAGASFVAVTDMIVSVTAGAAATTLSYEGSIP